MIYLGHLVSAAPWPVGCTICGMSTPRISLAKVMTQANKNDSNSSKQRPDQVRRGPGHRPADFGKPARATAEGRAHGAGHAGVRAVRHAVRRPLGAGTPFGH